MASIDELKEAVATAAMTEEASGAAEEAAANAKQRQTEADSTLTALLEGLRVVPIAVLLDQGGPPLLRRSDSGGWDTDKETRFCHGRVVGVGLSHEWGPDPFMEVDEPDIGDSNPRSFRIPVGTTQLRFVACGGSQFFTGPTCRSSSVLEKPKVLCLR